MSVGELGFNKKHPELKRDEIFLTNCSCNEDYNLIGRKTKRRGVISYDIDGSIVKRYTPVFINKDDIAFH